MPMTDIQCTYGENRTRFDRAMYTLSYNSLSNIPFINYGAFAIDIGYVTDIRATGLSRPFPSLFFPLSLFRYLYMCMCIYTVR